MIVFLPKMIIFLFKWCY